MTDSTQSYTDLVQRESCYKCAVGRIQRELGCELIGGEIIIIANGEGAAPGVIPVTLLCRRTNTQTTYDKCKACIHRPAAPPIRLKRRAVDILEAKGVATASKHLRDADLRLRKGDYDGAITVAVSAAESVMKHALDLHREKHPAKQTLPELWRACSTRLLCGDRTAEHVRGLVGSLSGTATALMGLRNALSDAHGNRPDSPEADAALAELALNISSTICVFVAQRFPENKQAQ